VADVNSRDRMAGEWFASGYSVARGSVRFKRREFRIAMKPIPTLTVALVLAVALPRAADAQDRLSHTF
jgi:hypothetical protein